MRRKPVDSGAGEDYGQSTSSPVPLPATVQYAPDYPIVTERLRLRPFSRGDVDAVFAYRSRADVAEYLFDMPMNHEECAEAVRLRTSQIGFTSEGDKIVLAAERIQDGRLIGEVSLIWRSVADLQAEVGYIFHPDAHGRGYASEAARALLAFGFEVMGLHRIYARCDARNGASARVMKRLGMSEEAHFREHMQVKGRWDEELICAILDREWFGPR
jgi:RimJ/RimL family protein N-acetyltransferase